MSREEYSAWSDELHAKVFDYYSAYPSYLLTKRYESFNEGRLLKKHEFEIEGNSFYEIGCATGELYRYLKTNMPRFEYHGFDISGPAIKRAIEKYGDDNFTHIQETDELTFGNENAAVVYSRDVVIHQVDPYEFLEKLVAITGECLILRLRTRDVGETEFDTDKSCQRHYGDYWVPYKVLNTDEMIDKISEDRRVRRIIISRRYEVLGGYNGRYLPKDLYYKDAKGAETAVVVMFGDGDREGAVEVIYDDKQDGPNFNIFDKVIARLMCAIKLGRPPSAHTGKD